MINLSKWILVFIYIPSTVFGQGPLREFLKKRWTEKQASKEAPVTSELLKESLSKAGLHTLQLKINESPRYFMIYIPPKLDISKPAEVLFVLHGGGGNMKIQSTEEYYHQLSVADQRGHIAVFPNGYSQFKSGEFATWNAGACCGEARDEKVDDVLFIKTILENLKASIKINSKRVFATGMSNGAMMSYRLACDTEGLFAGIAAVAGTDNTLQCDSKTPVSVLHIHAKDDDHVMFNGGAGKKAFKDTAKVTNFTSVPDTIKKWTMKSHCQGQPKTVLKTAGAECELYTNCSNGVRIQLCTTETGGHSWPGGEKIRKWGSGSSPSKALSANDVMWSFFDSLK